VDLPRPENPTQRPCQRSVARAGPNSRVLKGLTSRTQGRASGDGNSATPARPPPARPSRAIARGPAVVPIETPRGTRRCALSPMALRKFPPAACGHRRSGRNAGGFLPASRPGDGTSLARNSSEPERHRPYDSATRPPISEYFLSLFRNPLRLYSLHFFHNSFCLCPKQSVPATFNRFHPLCFIP